MDIVICGFLLRFMADSRNCLGNRPNKFHFDSISPPNLMMGFLLVAVSVLFVEERRGDQRFFSPACAHEAHAEFCCRVFGELCRWRAKACSAEAARVHSG